MRKMYVFAVLPLVISLVVAACSDSNSNIDISKDKVQSIQDDLGYALIPSFLPEDVLFSDITLKHSTESSSVCIYYHANSGTQTLNICYPWYTSPSNDDWTPPGYPEQPADAKIKYDINGMSAELCRGLWTDETLQRMQRAEFNDEGIIDGEWDYTKMLTLLFEVEVNDQVISVLIVAQPNMIEWITEDELIEVAESITEFN